MLTAERMSESRWATTSDGRHTTVDSHGRIHQPRQNDVSRHAIVGIGGGQILGERHESRFHRLVTYKRISLANG